MILGIIPARYESTRFPGKVLEKIKGKMMIEMVYANTKSAINEVYVATDSEKIKEAVQAFGGDVIMTDPKNKNGTERCSDAVIALAGQFKPELVVNIQADEPYLTDNFIKEFAKTAKRDDEYHVHTLIQPIMNLEDLLDKNIVKVVIDIRGVPLYFSRTNIPYFDVDEITKAARMNCFYKHIGIYSYRPKMLHYLAWLPETEIERCENLEQLRWMSYRVKIRCRIINTEIKSINVKSDL